VLEGLPGGICVTRDDHVVVYMNSALKKMLGDLTGKKCYETDLASEDICRTCPITGQLDEGNFPLVKVARTKDNRLIELTYNRVVDEKNRRTYYVSVERDVSEEAEREVQVRRLTASLDQMPYAAAVVDPEGRVVYVNSTFLNLTGFDPAKLSGYRFENMVGVNFQGKAIQEIMKESLSRGWDGETSILRQDGTRVFLHIQARPVRDAEGTTTLGVVGLFRDITRDRAEKAEFEKYRSRTEERMQERTDELARRVAQLTTINKISRAVTSLRSPDELMNEFVRSIATGFHYQHVLILMFDKDQGDLYFRAGYGPMITHDHSILRQKLKEGLIGHAAYFSETLVTGDVRADPRYIKKIIDKTISELAVPITFRGELLGVLDVQSEEQDAFTRSDVSLLEMLADILAAALTNAKMYSESKEREDALSVLDRISKQISMRLEPTVILDQVARDAATLLKGEKAMVGLISDDGKTLSWAASYNIPKDLFKGLAFHSDKGVSGRALKKLRTEIVNDYVHDPDASVRDRDIFHIRSLACAPLILKGRGIGVVNVYNKLEDKTFTKSDAMFLSSLADHATIALENANLLNSLNQRVKSQMALLDTTFSIQRQIESSSIYELVADKIKEVISCDALTFYKVDHAQNMMIPVVARGKYVEQIMADRFPIGQGLSGAVAKTGIAEVVNDPSSDPRIAQVPGTPKEEKEALMVIPLKGRERVIGVLTIYREGEKIFTSNDFEIAQLFATQASVAVENAELYSTQELLLKESRAKFIQMTKVLELTTSVMYMDDLDSLLQHIADAAVDSFGWRRASISLLDTQGNVFVNRALSGYPKWVRTGETMPVGTVLEDLEEEFRIGETTYYVKYERQKYGIEAFDFLAHPENAAKPRSAPDAWHERDILSVLLKDRNGRLIGYLLADEPVDMKMPTKDKVDVLEVLGSIASIGTENSRLYERQVIAVNEIALLNDLMTHDINNFNQGIMGYIELLLQDRELRESQRKYADKALVQVRNNARLIENLRKLSKVRSMSDRDFVPMDIYPAVTAAIEAVAKSYPERTVSVVSTITPGAHYVLANQYLNDLVLNVLHNSVKFDSAKRVKVDVTTNEDKSPQGEFWVISVIDRGRGIPDDRKRTVFERFATGMTGIKGFGLGLSIVSTIVEKYDGRIWVEDRVKGDFSKGAVFKVMLHKAMAPEGTQASGPRADREALK